MPLHNDSYSREGIEENGGFGSEDAKSLPADVKTLQLELLSMRLKIDSMERFIESLDPEPGTTPPSRSPSPASSRGRPEIPLPRSPPSVVPMPRYYDGPKPYIMHSPIRHPPPSQLEEAWDYGSRPPPEISDPPPPSAPRPLLESTRRRTAPHTSRSHHLERSRTYHRPRPLRVNNDTDSDDSSLVIRDRSRLPEDSEYERTERLLRALMASHHERRELRQEKRGLNLLKSKDISAKAGTANAREAQELRAGARAEAVKGREDEIVEEERFKDELRKIQRAKDAGRFYSDILVAKYVALSADAGFPQGPADDGPVQRGRPEQGPPILSPEIYAAHWDDFRDLGNHRGLEPLAALTMLVGEIPLSGDSTPQVLRPSATKKGADPSLADDMANLKSPARFHPMGYSAQEPLPERVRVCEPIVRFLEHACVGRPALNKHDPRILLRPYRILVYFEAAIRGCYLYWADKFGVRSSRLPTTRRVSHAWDENHEAHPPRAWSINDVKYVECLLDFMDQYLVPRLEYISSPACESITFPDMWHLFKPGDFVIGESGRQVYRILSIASTGHRAAMPYRDYLKASQTSPDTLDMPFRMLCVHIDFNGRQLGPVTTEITFKKFDGAKAISTLEVQPVHFDHDPARRSKFVRRGRRFFRAAAVQHLHYAGLTLDTRDEVDSQVVVDFTECLLTQADETKAWQPFVDAAIGDGALPPQFESCEEACCNYDYIYHDEDVETKRDEDFMSSLLPPQWKHSKLPSMAVYPRTLEEANTEENQITDDEYLIMSYRVFGFVMKTRKWAQLDIDYLKPVGARRGENDLPEHEDQDSQNSQSNLEIEEVSFDQLVLPRGHKEMVLSLVAQHYRNKETAVSSRTQFDIVRGKGKGLILLLHGAPGVGKTSTAECVAERFDKPLFQITCGDLGTTAKDVEKALERNFSLANKWGCILLLDEADVFLARRTSNDFARNGLVAVFLRTLEYYAGILFLTTNRVGDFDEAFTSRIHISLYYPPLDEESTDAVFSVNLGRIRRRFEMSGRRLDVDEVEVRMFARRYWQDNPKARWNGRQIRNACQTALALSEFEAQGGMAAFEAARAAGFRYDTRQRDDAGTPVKLTVKDFETVAAAYVSFVQYLDNIYGTDAETRAKESFLRAMYRDVTERGAVAAGAPPWLSNAAGWQHLSEGMPAMAGQRQGQYLQHQQHQQEHRSKQKHKQPSYQTYSHPNQGFSAPQPNGLQGPTSTGFPTASQDGSFYKPPGTCQQGGSTYSSQHLDLRGLRSVTPSGLNVPNPGYFPGEHADSSQQ